jgi:hypothetical protein
MSRLDDLQKTVEQMTTEELLELTRKIRADRRVSKRVKRTTTKASRAKAADSLKELLKGKSREEILEIFGKK